MRVAVFCALFATLAVADDPKPEPKPALAVEAEVLGETGRLGQRLVVRLVNQGKEPVSVVTGKLRLKGEAGDKALAITLEMVEKKMDKGRLLVPPGDTLGIVKLMPGEVAAVTVPVAAVQKHLAKVGGRKVTVSYEVSAFWGKRFGVWSGKVSTEAALAK